MDSAYTIEIQEPGTHFADVLTHDLAIDDFPARWLPQGSLLGGVEHFRVLQSSWYLNCSYTSTMFEKNPWSLDWESSAVVDSAFSKLLLRNVLSYSQMSRLIHFSFNEHRWLAHWQESVSMTGAHAPVEQANYHHSADQIEDLLTDFPDIERVGLAVYTVDGLHQFLSTPMERFGGRTGIELIRNGESGRVLSALASDYEGLG